MIGAFITGYLVGSAATLGLIYLGFVAHERRAAISDPQACELDNSIPLRTELPRVPVQLTGGRIPHSRRVRRFFRDLVRFLSARRFRL